MFFVLTSYYICMCYIGKLSWTGIELKSQVAATSSTTTPSYGDAYTHALVAPTSSSSSASFLASATTSSVADAAGAAHVGSIAGLVVDDEVEEAVTFSTHTANV